MKEPAANSAPRASMIKIGKYGAIAKTSPQTIAVAYPEPLAAARANGTQRDAPYGDFLILFSTNINVGAKRGPSCTGGFTEALSPCQDSICLLSVLRAYHRFTRWGD